MAYAQTSYLQKQGINGRYTIHDIGCFLTAFCNLMTIRYGQDVNPLTLNAFFVNSGRYIDIDDGVRDDLGWESIQYYNGNVKITRLVDRGMSQTAGLPGTTQAIVKFYYYSTRLQAFTTHFALYDGDGWIIDSWDGVRKHINSTIYGSPVAFAEYTLNAPVSTPAPAPAAPSGNAVHLPASVASWAAYRRGSGLRKGTSDQVGTLSPAQFGGLTYAIEGWVGDYAVNISTQSFGPVTIWVKDTDAQFLSIAPPAPTPAPEPPKAPVGGQPPVAVPLAEKLTLIVPVMAFDTSGGAEQHRGVANPIGPGDYFVHEKKGMAWRLSDDNRVDRPWWINTADNKVEEPEVVAPQPDPSMPETPAEPESPVEEPTPEKPVFKIVHHFLKLDANSKPIGVKFDAINQVPVKVVDFVSGEERTLAEYNMIDGTPDPVVVVSWFLGPDGQKYYMPELTYMAGKGYGIRHDLLREIKKRGALDFNNDGKVDLDDIAQLGGFIATEGKRGYEAAGRFFKDVAKVDHKLNLSDKTLNTYHGVKQKVIDGIQFRGKVKK
jgi:hypothetical protein